MSLTRDSWIKIPFKAASPCPKHNYLPSSHPAASSQPATHLLCQSVPQAHGLCSQAPIRCSGVKMQAARQILVGRPGYIARKLALLSVALRWYSAMAVGVKAGTSAGCDSSVAACSSCKRPAWSFEFISAITVVPTPQMFVLAFRRDLGFPWYCSICSGAMKLGVPLST